MEINNIELKGFSDIYSFYFGKWQVFPSAYKALVGDKKFNEDKTVIFEGKLSIDNKIKNIHVGLRD